MKPLIPVPSKFLPPELKWADSGSETSLVMAPIFVSLNVRLAAAHFVLAAHDYISSQPGELWSKVVHGMRNLPRPELCAIDDYCDANQVMCDTILEITGIDYGDLMDEDSDLKDAYLLLDEQARYVAKFHYVERLDEARAVVSAWRASLEEPQFPRERG